MKTAKNVVTNAESAFVSDVYLRKLLLECVLSDGAISINAFKEWEKLVVFDDLDAQSFLLLPLVYLKLVENKIESGRFFLRIKSIYRRTWTENQILSNHLSQLLPLFEKAALPFIIASDKLNLINLYKDFGAFSLQGFLIFAPFQNKKEFMQSLAKRGWTPIFDKSEKTEFRFEDFFSIEINWKTRAEFIRCRERTKRTMSIGAHAFMLEPEEQIINLCASGFSTLWENNIHRQIAVASFFNKQSIDNEKLVSYAREHGLSAKMSEMFQDLIGVFGVKIPKETVFALKQNQNDGRFDLLRQKMRRIRTDFASATEYRKHRYSFSGFVEFLAMRWRADSSGRLVIYGTNSILKILRGKIWNGR